MITINATLYNDVLLNSKEASDMLVLLDLEIIRMRFALADTNDRGVKQMYLQKLKCYGDIADRIRFSPKVRMAGK